MAAIGPKHVVLLCYKCHHLAIFIVVFLTEIYPTLYVKCGLKSVCWSIVANFVTAYKHLLLFLICYGSSPWIMWRCAL